MDREYDLFEVFPDGSLVWRDSVTGHEKAILSCLSWKWRKRSSVKITERTHEETTEALHAGREGRHSEEAFGGRSADLGSV